jgi:hypothetical protein
VSVVWAPVALTRRRARTFVEGDPQVDLDLPAGDAHVVDDKPQQLLALPEVELVDAGGGAAGEVADSLLEPVVEGKLLALGDQFVALAGECVVTEVDVS